MVGIYIYILNMEIPNIDILCENNLLSHIICSIIVNFILINVISVHLCITYLCRYIILCLGWYWVHNTLMQKKAR